MKSNYPLTKTSELRVKLYVKDFYKMRRFYKNFLGYPIAAEWAEKNSKGMMFNAGSAVIELLWEPGKYNPVKNCRLSLKIKDVWKLWKKVKDHGDIVFHIRDNPWGDTSFAINDPEGFEITFFSPTKR